MRVDITLISSITQQKICELLKYAIYYSQSEISIEQLNTKKRGGTKLK